MNRKNHFVVAIALGLMSTFTMAANEPSYIEFHYNIHSINPSITDAQCESLLKEPRRYTITNDQVTYLDNPNYTVSNYQRTGVTYLSKTQYLFTGISTFHFKFNDKAVTAKETAAFVLMIPEQRIQGSFIIEGYCQGNLIGLNQNSNQWPPQ